ncbi:MAG TPA: adenylyltransferase/cytidyltransferase family protein [Patescibacteria group bacterium]|nr:adenylyltransferase/cytidyltransferase family protein [Patescibacteria group bacterium]
MSKIKKLNQIAKLTKKLSKEGKKTALITGCFDIVHIGHIQLFRFAKKNADVVIVGLDNDKSIRLSKGIKRPVNNLEYRCQTIAELESVDYVFPIEDTITFNTSDADEIHIVMLQKIKPDLLITNPIADKYWKDKQKRAKELGIKFLPITRQKMTSSTEIIDKLLSEI